MRARWRIENLFKYLDFYGIDYLADYRFTIQANTHGPGVFEICPGLGNIS